MTPAARIAAAIGILDAVLEGGAVETVIASWARRSRYAGSSDRSGIRDLVYDALRRRKSLAAWGGAETGRGMMLGALRTAGIDAEEVFGSGRYAPPALTDDERVRPHGPWREAVVLDCPDHLLPLVRRSLGPRMNAVLALMRARADVHVRTNLSRTSREALTRRLRDAGIEAMAHPLSPSALSVGEGARGLRSTEAFGEGLFELQDAGSQAVADAIPIAPGARVLDFCAGAGGKTLAMAGRADAEWYVHDAYEDRMRDLPERVARARCRVELLPQGTAAENAPYDVVLVDAPCSGSGTWRRDPEAKWSLSPERLEELVRVQADILDKAAALLAPGGVIAYVTCSLLLEENAWQVAAFRRRHKEWRSVGSLSLTPLDGGDGFYLALLRR